MSALGKTLVASLESVADAAILALPGWFLSKKGFMTKPGRKLLAQISQHITFPLLLFTSILFCQQDGGSYRGAKSSCPNMLKTITASWIVLLWPFYVVACGLVVGKIMAKVSKASTNFEYAAMAAVGFGNSTGLPLTLVSIIHNSASTGSPLSRTDPAVYVSIYLIFNPILQWSVGLWLLEPSSSNNDDKVLSKTNLDNALLASSSSPFHSPTIDDRKRSESLETIKLSSHNESNDENEIIIDSLNDDNDQRTDKENKDNKDVENKPFTCASVLSIIHKQLAQPTIIASLTGLFIACIRPLHGILVDVHDQDGDAPLEFIFEALYTIGKAAIPINMMMLGSTLAEGIKNIPPDFKWGPNLAVAFGKLMIQPLIATITVCILHEIIPVKSNNAASLYFAMLIVTCTPTANSVNVMAEIGGVNKDTIGLCILTQYAFAPITVTLWVTLFQYLVRNW